MLNVKNYGVFINEKEYSRLFSQTFFLVDDLMSIIAVFKPSDTLRVH